MKRLTGRFSNGDAHVLGCGKNCQYDYVYCVTNPDLGNCPTLVEIYDKLAMFEDLIEQEKIELPLPKLDACPFCGNEHAPRVNKYSGKLKYAVCCDPIKYGCGATGSYNQTKLEAAEAWNERA